MNRLYDFDSVKNSIKLYAFKYNGNSCRGGYKDLITKVKERGNITDDDILEYISIYEKLSTIKVSHKEFVRAMLKYKKYFESIDDDISITIINKLIGDRRLFNKMRFCLDGSYRLNRIFIERLSPKYLRFYITGSDELSPFTIYNNGNDNIKKSLTRFFNKFDTIFVHIFGFSFIDINSDNNA